MSTNRNSASAAETEVQVAYAHKGVLYLPHYTKPGLTVAQIAERAGVTGDQVSNALIFGTLKALPANLPETIGAHWLQNGVLPAEAGLPC